MVEGKWLCLVKVYIRKKNMMGGTPLFKKNILYVFNININQITEGPILAGELFVSFPH